MQAHVSVQFQIDLLIIIKAWLNLETLLRMQIFPILAAQLTCVAETNFSARKQKMLLPGVRNIFVPGHKFCIRNICFPV